MFGFLKKMFAKNQDENTAFSQDFGQNNNQESAEAPIQEETSAPEETGSDSSFNSEDFGGNE